MKFERITACGEYCDGCADIEKKIHWKPNVVERMRELAEKWGDRND